MSTDGRYIVQRRYEYRGDMSSGKTFDQFPSVTVLFSDCPAAASAF